MKVEKQGKFVKIILPISSHYIPRPQLQNIKVHIDKKKSNPYFD